MPIGVCDGTAQAYQADVATFGERRFQRGTATASASGEVRRERDGERITQRTSIDRQPIRISRG